MTKINKNTRSNTQIDFIEGTKEYLLEMSIDLHDLESHLMKKYPNNIDLFVKYIDFLVNLQPEEEKQSALGVTRDKYNSQVVNYWNNYGIKEGMEEYETADTLRHAFIAFKEHGVLGLYKTREAEGWYPVVVINKIIMSNNNITLLNDILTIYRGTSKKEYISKKYAQSWTVSEQVAHEFAFVHYNNGHKMHENMQRVLMKSKIKKEDVFYSDIDGIEKEVIINPEKLILTPEILREETLCINVEFEYSPSV